MLRRRCCVPAWRRAVGLERQRARRGAAVLAGTQSADEERAPPSRRGRRARIEDPSCCPACPSHIKPSRATIAAACARPPLGRGPSVSSGVNVSFGARGDARGLLSRCVKAVAERPPANWAMSHESPAAKKKKPQKPRRSSSYYFLPPARSKGSLLPADVLGSVRHRR